MESVSALNVVFTAPERSAIARSAGLPGHRVVRRRRVPGPAAETLPASPPEAPPALVVVGLPGTDPLAAVRALLDIAEPVRPAPASSFLVLEYGHRGEAVAYVPGYRQRPADPYAPAAPPAAPTRPPRRVESRLPAPLLKDLTVVVAPPVGDVGPAYSRVVADAAERGGALLLAAGAQSPLTQAELDLAVQAAERGVAVFVATVHAPDTEDWSPIVEAARLDAQRQAPVLAGARWYAFDGTARSAAELRESIMAWAGQERLRRAAAGLRRGADGPIRVAVDGPDSGWEDMLAREVKWRCHSVWQRLAIELAHIHLRGVHELIFGAGCPGLPPLLDLELHALSGLATRQLDAAVTAVIDRVLPQVLAAAPGEAELHLIGNALRRTLEHDQDAPGPDRVLLVTSTAGLAVAAGTGAGVALPAYRARSTGALAAVVPPIGIALTGGCYLLWRDPHGDVDECRCWLQQVVREVESELRRELELRFDALHRAVRALLVEAVDHGIILI
ncbi:MAG TPA: hypothetical protein VFM54_18175 [Micromonosporaceae bacterium]|nr:hypothetical protein [Micromonosporaceae bacterium]